MTNQYEPQTDAGEATNTYAEAGDQTPLDESQRKTGVDADTDAQSTALPESPENDSVPGSPNQGTESR